MEGITMINAEKTVVSGLSAKTASTIAATDLIQLYANDGTPNGKISKADLMKTVKASLPALLSDQGTNGNDFLTLLTDGTLGKTTLANAASVLGATTTAITDWDNVPFYGMFSSTSTASNAPAGSGYFTGFQFFSSRHQHTYQVAIRSSDLTIYLRVKISLSGSWGSWKKIESTALA